MCIALCLVSAQSCGIIGNDDDVVPDRREDLRFYLDLNYPATCNGTITSWTVCYYGPGQTNMMRSYWATYTVYRRNDSGGEDRYERVSDIFSAVRATENVIQSNKEPLVDGLIQNDDFMCYNDSVDTSDSPLTVQVGDIIGACVFDPQEDDVNFNREPLNIVGDIMNGESLWRSRDDGCTMDTIPSSVLRSTLDERNDRRLHIYANIGNNHCPQGDIV